MTRAAAVVVLMAAALTACSDDPGHVEEGAHEESAHVHVAPHGGTLVPLEDEFAHLEFVLEPAASRLTCYVLGPHAEKPVRLEQETIRIDLWYSDPDIESFPPQLTADMAAKASPLTGESVGDSSQFEVTDEVLGLIDAFTGSVRSVTVRGRKFESVRFDYP